MSNDEDDDVSYGNTHRALLQALLARQTITLAEAKPLIAAIEAAANDVPQSEAYPGAISQADLDDYIHTLNAAISPFDLEIRSSIHQVSKDRVYALVNTTSDALTQMATIHSADEIAFVKRVLDAMFDTYNTPRAEVMAVTSMQALKLSKPDGERRVSSTQATSQNAGLTMAQAEKVIGDLVAEGWFELSQRGYYSLSPRALMELRGWLLDTYNERAEEDDDDDEEVHDKIKLCQACKEIVTFGQRCPRMACQARLHNHCKPYMFRAQGGSEQCPLCKSAWTEVPPVGEMAAKKSRTSIASAASRRSRGMGMDGAAGGDSDADEGAS